MSADQNPGNWNIIEQIICGLQPKSGDFFFKPCQNVISEIGGQLKGQEKEVFKNVITFYLISMLFKIEKIKMKLAKSFCQKNTRKFLNI